jgi:protein SEY1
MLFQAQLTKALAEPVEALLDSATEDTWLAIRKLLQRETKAAISGLESALAAFELDEATDKELLQKLENHGRSVVESKAKEEAGRVLIRMKDR